MSASATFPPSILSNAIKSRSVLARKTIIFAASSARVILSGSCAIPLTPSFIAARVSSVSFFSVASSVKRIGVVET